MSITQSVVLTEFSSYAVWTCIQAWSLPCALRCAPPRLVSLLPAVCWG